MKNVIVLGGTAAHVPLIISLKKRGYYVILIDYLDNPPAKQFADLHIKTSTLDKESVLDVAKKYNVVLTISSSVDQANVVACYVNEQLGLTNPYPYDTALRIANKIDMKKTMFLNGIPSTNYVVLKSNQVSADVSKLSFPMIVKPSDACAASGVKKVDNFIELNEAIINAKKFSRSGDIIIEEFFSGIEISAYCFVTNNIANVLMVAERISVNDGPQHIMKCIATITPPNITIESLNKIQHAATKIANVYGINNCPFHIQALVNKDNISVIEFAPRVGGGISYETIRLNNGFDIINATIDSYLNIPVSIPPIKNNSCYAVSIIYGKPCVFGKLIINNFLFSRGYIESIHYHKSSGSTIDDDKASSSRLASFITKGKDRNEIVKKIDCVFNTIDAVDLNNNSVLRRDLRLTK